MLLSLQSWQHGLGKSEITIWHFLVVAPYSGLQPHCVLRYGSRWAGPILARLGPGSSARAPSCWRRTGPAALPDPAASTACKPARRSAYGPNLCYSSCCHSSSSRSSAVSWAKGWILPAPRRTRGHALLSPSAIIILYFESNYFQMELI